MWDSKYLVSIFPRRHCDHQFHNGNPDEEHMQLLSLNKISQFPLHPGTMGLSPGRWLSSYTWGAIIASKPLPSLHPHSFYPTSLLRLHQPSPDSFPMLWVCYLSQMTSFHSAFTSLPPLFVSLFFSPPFLRNRGKSERDLVPLAVTDLIDKRLLLERYPILLMWGTPLSEWHCSCGVCQGAVLIMRDFWVGLL